MSINFPTSLDTLTNPTGTDLLENAVAGLDHDVQHSNANDAIEALEAKVGANSSAVTTSHDYKLGEVIGTDKAVGKTATQTLTNKTLTSPQINFGSDARGDIMVRNGSGVSTRLPIGTSGQILQASASGDPEWVANPAASNATYSVAGIATLDADARYYAADAGSNDTYVITLSPVPSAYVTGMKISFKANTINTGAATINVNSLGAKTIVKGVNTTLADGDIAAGMLCTIIYDGTNFVLQNPVTTAVTPTFSGLFKNGSTTKTGNEASVTQNIAHGLGVIPKKVAITFDSQTGTSESPHGRARLVYNGTTSSCIGHQYSNGAIRDMNNGGNIRLYGVNQTVYQDGVVTFDATNIIITWTKTGDSYNFDILWEAEA